MESTPPCIPEETLLVLLNFLKKSASVVFDRSISNTLA